jgi:hypothetical protein
MPNAQRSEVQWTKTVGSPLLFEISRPLDHLEQMLLNDVAGHSLSSQALYEEHSVGKPYILRNYQDALRKLESEGKIIMEPPAERRQRRSGEVTLGKNVMLTFLGVCNHGCEVLYRVD